jgi:hypothetical protein
MAQVQAPNITLTDQDNTSVQGFEPAANNVIAIDPNDCPHCLKPFYGRGAEGTRINVYTARGKDQWCAGCVEKGTKEKICIQESKLSKEDKKLWEKKLKKDKKQIL